MLLTVVGGFAGRHARGRCVHVPAPHGNPTGIQECWRPRAPSAVDAFHKALQSPSCAVNSPANGLGRSGHTCPDLWRRPLQHPQRRQQPDATSNGCQSLSTSRCASAKQALHACDCGKTLRQDPGHQEGIAQPEDHASACRSSENLSLLLHAVQLDSHSKKFLAPIYRSLPRSLPSRMPAQMRSDSSRIVIQVLLRGPGGARGRYGAPSGAVRRLKPSCTCPCTCAECRVSCSRADCRSRFHK